MNENIKKLLEKQLELLSERSDKETPIQDLVALSNAMVKVSNTVILLGEQIRWQSSSQALNHLTLAQPSELKVSNQVVKDNAAEFWDKFSKTSLVNENLE